MSLSASLQKINHSAFLKGDHQAAVVELSQLALSSPFPADLALQTPLLVSQVLQVEQCLIWELADDGRNLLNRSSLKDRDESSVLTLIPLEPDSLEGNTISSLHPILLENMSIGNQIKPSGWIVDRGMRSGVGIRIGTPERPYGVLEAFSKEEQYFSQRDVQFLQSVANIVGMAMHHDRSLREQTSSLGNDGSARARPITQSGQVGWGSLEVKSRQIESRERERLRLAQELHDAPIQDLYGLIYQLEDLKDALKNPEGEIILDEFDHTLRKVINSLRTICRELRPPSLSPFGLEVAIRDHVEKFQDQNPDVKVNLELTHDKQILSDSLRLTLFRIYQQAIHNVERHAQATEVHIRFHRDENTVILEVEDNGDGFEVPGSWMALVREEHFGLLDIAERVEGIRGKLEIVSAPGSGTLVRAIVPYASTVRHEEM